MQQVETLHIEGSEGDALTDETHQQDAIRGALTGPGVFEVGQEPQEGISPTVTAREALGFLIRISMPYAHAKGGWRRH